MKLDKNTKNASRKIKNTISDRTHVILRIYTCIRWQMYNFKGGRELEHNLQQSILNNVHDCWVSHFTRPVVYLTVLLIYECPAKLSMHHMLACHRQPSFVTPPDSRPDAKQGLLNINNSRLPYWTLTGFEQFINWKHLVLPASTLPIYRRPHLFNPQKQYIILIATLYSSRDRHRRICITTCTFSTGFLISLS